MKELETVDTIKEISMTKEGVDIFTGENKMSYSFDKYSRISITRPFIIKGEETDTPVDRDEYFDKLLSQFNTVLPVPIYSSGSTSSVYTYLKKSFDLAWYEFYKNGSPLFSNDTYPIVYSYRGNNKEYYNISLDSMVSWLMAMLLSELIPTTGKETNNQTKLFALAYNIGGGRNVPLYGNFDVHADPMIARLAAGAIYAAHRSSYTFSEIDSLRKLIGGSAINAKDWNGLGYQDNDYLGYLVNSDSIIPSAPGPYADGCDNRIKPYEQGQPKDQFCSDLSKEWYKDNYTVDAEIDDYMVSNFNMQAQTSLTTWNSYNKATKLLLIEAAAAPRATDHYFFGKKYIKFDGVYMGSRAGNYKDYWYFWFSEVSSIPTDTNDFFEVRGPFAQFEPKMFSGSGYGTKTSAMDFFDNIMEIADNSRLPTFYNQYGRRRPCGGSVDTGGSARSPINGDPLNATYNIDISCIFADGQESANIWSQEDGFVTEKPKSYPSGHAAMTWAVAMILGQMKPEDIIDYMRGAYKVGVNRTLSRFHWNSDVIYGRLFGTMIVPIINAMSGLQASYEQTKAIINEEEIEGDWKVGIILKNLTGSPIRSTGEIRIYVDNHDYGINTYLPGARVTAGALYTFNVGENDLRSLDVHCEMNGGVIDDSFNGKSLDNEARIYDYRHYNSTDCGWKVTLDTSDSRCDTKLNKAGATYVIKIENI